jgi:hypothetical protein
MYLFAWMAQYKIGFSNNDGKVGKMDIWIIFILIWEDGEMSIYEDTGWRKEYLPFNHWSDD